MKFKDFKMFCITFREHSFKNFKQNYLNTSQSKKDLYFFDVDSAEISYKDMQHVIGKS